MSTQKGDVLNLQKWNKYDFPIHSPIEKNKKSKKIEIVNPPDVICSSNGDIDPNHHLSISPFSLFMNHLEKRMNTYFDGGEEDS